MMSDPIADPAILEAFSRAEHPACIELADTVAADPERRTRLTTALHCIDRAARANWLDRPAELMAFRQPARYPGLALETLRTLLRHAEADDDATVAEILAGLDFVHLPALRSATAFTLAQLAVTPLPA